VSRGGQDKDRDAGPERRCIATGDVCPKPDLIRFVVDPDGVIQPDVLGRLPGRGIWVRADRAALDRAVGKRLFARAARQPVNLPPDLIERVETLLLGRVTSLLALARKAGDAVAGFEKVKEALDSGWASTLLQASDGSARGKTKLSAPPGPTGFIGCLTASELGLAFGRDRVIHGALTAGGLATRVVDEAARLAGVRADEAAPQAAGKDLRNA
jgi:predicted RNA-binding protein YlxR (DUF448 family)